MARGLQRVKCQTNSRPLLNLFQIFLLVEKHASFPQAIQAEKNNLLFDIVIIIIAIALSFSSDTHCTKGCQMTKVKMHLQGWMYITLYFCHNLIIKITNYISKRFLTMILDSQNLKGTSTKFQVFHKISQMALHNIHLILWMLSVMEWVFQVWVHKWIIF